MAAHFKKSKQERRRLLVRDRQGSALLVALIIMGILMTIAIGVSEVLIRSVHDSRQLIDRTTAWYRAESGIETALNKITNNAPGFEEKDIEEKREDGTELYKYSISAAAITVPENPYSGAPVEETYSDLALGQTVNIPLFSAAQSENTSGSSTESQEVQGVTEFKLYYYLNGELKLKGGIRAADLDILRWKIFGKNKITGISEVINGLIPEDPKNEDFGIQVSCLGTAQESTCYSTGKYLEQQEGEVIDTPQKPIDDFLNTHSQNFLAITNMINVDMITGANLGVKEKKQLSSIKYKLIQLGGAESDKRLTLPTIKVTADGFEKNTKQSIDIEISRERSLPVFNYALYRTKP